MRRIGEVVREQVELYGTLTGARPPAPAPRRPAAGGRPRPTTSRAAAAPRGRHEPRRRPQGRALARAQRLAALRRARRGRAGAPRPRGRRRSTSATTSSRGCATSAPDVAFVALHGRDGEDGTVQELLEVLGIPYTGSGVSACIRCADKVLAKHAFRDAGLPTPDFFAWSRGGVQGARRRRRAAGDRGAPRRSRSSSSRRGRARRSGSSSRATAADVPGALVAAFSYDHKVLLERYVNGRDLAVSVLDGEALPIVEAVPLERRLLRLRGALRDRAHRVRLPRRRCRTSATARAQELALDAYRAARLQRLRARRPDVRPRLRRAPAARGQPGARA